MTDGYWRCPSLERADHALIPDRKTIDSYKDVETVKKLARENRSIPGFSGYLLPVWQGMEALVYGRQILQDSVYPLPGEYCIHKLKEIEDFEFDLLSDPLIRATLETIRQCREEALILEVQSPFSILAGLMDPMDLYLCFTEDSERLKEILERLAAASAEYIRACIAAGCRMISLADPVGTMDMVGPNYYRDFCGPSEISLLKKCRPYLDGTVIHLCMKMSRSLVLAGLAEAEPVDSVSGPKTGITGMSCIHRQGPGMEGARLIRLI